MTITTLFLDVGGVLLTNGWDSSIRKKTIDNFHLDFNVFEKRHQLVVDLFEIGKMSLDEYLDTTVFYETRAFSKDQFTDFIFKQSEPFQETIDLMRTLKGIHNLKVVVVSNESREITEYRLKTFNLKFIDFFVVSCFVHYRKPDFDIYRVALDLAQAKPEEVAYVEDRLLYVEMAKKYGIRGIHHVILEKTTDELNQLMAKTIEKTP